MVVAEDSDKFIVHIRTSASGRVKECDRLLILSLVCGHSNNRYIEDGVF